MREITWKYRDFIIGGYVDTQGLDLILIVEYFVPINNVCNFVSETVYSRGKEKPS